MKRTFDIVATVVALPLIIPLGIVVALLVRANLGSPVIFQQIRPGLHEQPFRLYKFRSMSTATAPDGALLPDAVRLTSFGRFLRSTSLDELPSFWNVLCGQMSLVGPRPLRVEYLPLYTSVQRRRHEVRPGITGWAQVNGRNLIAWEDRFVLDVWYVDHRSLALDLRILFRTLARVVRRDGISAKNEATMPRFLGSSHHVIDQDRTNTSR